MFKKKSLITLVSLLAILCVTVGGTLAFLIDTSGPIQNIFNPSKVTTSVEETLSGNTKSNVKIKNTGDTDAFIRAAVVVTWQDAQGNVYGKKPVETTDYTIQLGKDWLDGADGFYYHITPVKSEKEAPTNCTTGVLIESISPIATSVNNIEANGLGYYLTVEIIGSGIQNKPASVFNTEWASSNLEVKNTDKDPMEWTLGQKQGG